jgi:hypothetical protein
MNLNFDLGFTREEKILSFVPIIFALIDHASTFLGAKQITVLFLYERNTGITNIVSTYGAEGLFLWLFWVQLLLFISAIVIISISKHYGINIKYIYALFFLYCGFRIDGALSWCVV